MSLLRAVSTSTTGHDVHVNHDEAPPPYYRLLRRIERIGRTVVHVTQISTAITTKKIKHRSPAVFFDTPSVDPIQGLKEMVARSHEVIAHSHTIVSPGNWFPDSITIDRSKVTLVKRAFFWASDTVSIRIEDILHVESTVGPLFGDLVISSRVMNSTDHFDMRGFWKNDARELQRILQGYIIALQHDIDVSKLSKRQLRKLLLELG